MLYEISREIETELIARECVYPVVYGPERVPTSIVNCRIVIERERGAGEDVGAPKHRGVNPRPIATRSIAGRCLVFAKSSKAGANVWDHEREADLAVDLLIVALHASARRRCSEYRVTGGKILAANELEYEGLSAWPGVVYELTFEIDRGVSDAKWTGEKRPEATIGEGGIAIATGATVGGDAVGSSDLPSVETRVE